MDTAGHVREELAVVEREDSARVEKTNEAATELFDAHGFRHACECSNLIIIRSDAV